MVIKTKRVPISVAGLKKDPKSPDIRARFAGLCLEEGNEEKAWYYIQKTKEPGECKPLGRSFEKSRGLKLQRTPSIRQYCMVSRADFFVTSLLPQGVVLAVALYYNDPVTWELVPAVFIGLAAIHWMANLTDEYFDFMKGIDQKTDEGFKHPLAEGTLSPGSVKMLLCLSFCVVIACSIPVFLVRGWLVVLFIAAGISGGFFYTAPPLNFKYRGLGEAGIMLFMGPLLGVGGYLALTGRISLPAGLLLFPSGLIIAAVVNSNNIRDLRQDSRAGIRTVPAMIGVFKSSVLVAAALALSFLIIIFMVMADLLPLSALLVLGLVPMAVSNLRTLFRLDPQNMPWIDKRLAKLDISFHGILLIILLVATWR